MTQLKKRLNICNLTYIWMNAKFFCILWRDDDSALYPFLHTRHLLSQKRKIRELLTVHFAKISEHKRLNFLSQLRKSCNLQMGEKECFVVVERSKKNSSCLFRATCAHPRMRYERRVTVFAYAEHERVPFSADTMPWIPSRARRHSLTLRRRARIFMIIRNVSRSVIICVMEAPAEKSPLTFKCVRGANPLSAHQSDILVGSYFISCALRAVPRIRQIVRAPLLFRATAERPPGKLIARNWISLKSTRRRRRSLRWVLCQQQRWRGTRECHYGEASERATLLCEK